MRWGYPMTKRQLTLSLSDRTPNARKGVRQNNRSLARWWFRRMAAELEETGAAAAAQPSGRSQEAAQETFPWR